jgi:hypothetical protein
VSTSQVGELISITGLTFETSIAFDVSSRAFFTRTIAFVGRSSSIFVTEAGVVVRKKPGCGV